MQGKATIQINYFETIFDPPLFLFQLEFQDAALAKEFEALVLGDPRFEIVAEVNLGVVCFKLKVFFYAFFPLLYLYLL